MLRLPELSTKVKYQERTQKQQFDEIHPVEILIGRPRLDSFVATRPFDALRQLRAHEYYDEYLRQALHYLDISGDDEEVLGGFDAPDLSLLPPRSDLNFIHIFGQNDELIRLDGQDLPPDIDRRCASLASIHNAEIPILGLFAYAFDPDGSIFTSPVFLTSVIPPSRSRCKRSDVMNT